MRIFLIVILVLVLILSACSNQTTISCQPGYQLEGKSCVPSTTCGNNLCETGEDSTFCPYDCEKECVDNSCNGQAQAYCEPACPNQEELLTSYAAMQEKVVTCLEGYFQIKVPRVNYKIVHQVEAACQDPRGCCCSEGGMTSVGEVRHINFNGYTTYQEYQPTSVEQMLPDEHETTHFILYHIVHNHPAWFSEGIAIQTNERVQCDVKIYQGKNSQVQSYLSRGDAHLRETSTDKESRGGVMLGDGTA